VRRRWTATLRERVWLVGVDVHGAIAHDALKLIVFIRIFLLELL
jgi:hypothetical protein